MLNLKTLIPSLALAFGIAATGCKTQDVSRATAAISAVTVQQGLNEKDITFLRQRNVTIAIDDALATQKTGFFDNRMQAIFKAHSGNVKNGGILSIAADVSAEDATAIISAFAAELRRNNVKPVMIATSLLSSVNLSYIDWQAAGNFNKATIKKNQSLLGS